MNSIHSINRFRNPDLCSHRPTMGGVRDRFMIRPNIKLRVRVGSGVVVGS